MDVLIVETGHFTLNHPQTALYAKSISPNRMEQRKSINFFASYYDIAKCLNDKARLEWYDTIMKIQFLEIHIDDIEIKSKDLKLLFVSIKHSLKSSIEGYCNRKKISYKALFSGAYGGGSQGAYGGGSGEEEVQEEVQVQVQEEVQEEEKPFSFTLSRKVSISSVSSKYLVELERYIKSTNKPMTYQAFYDSCEMNGYKYKNFKAAYNKWNADTPAPKNDGRIMDGYTW